MRARSPTSTTREIGCGRPSIRLQEQLRSIYDDLDRLTSEANPQGTLSYGYDNAGRRTSMTVAGQAAVTYGYDDTGRTVSISQGSSAVAFTHDAAGRRTSLTLPNSITTSYSYDAASQIIGLTYATPNAKLGDLTYEYDSTGRRTTTGGSFARTGIPGALSSATYNANNQLTQRGGTSFSYDPNGNLATDGVTSYTWNARNQLVGLSGASSASFAYDAIGRRRGKTIGSTTTNFLYDGFNLVQELSGSTPTANLLTGWGIDEAFTRTDAGGTSSFLVDALGSTLELADGSGALQ